MAKEVVRTWHGWFAWYPVKTDKGAWVWLRPILRQRWYERNWAVPGYFYTYSTGGDE